MKIARLLSLMTVVVLISVAAPTRPVLSTATHRADPLATVRAIQTAQVGADTPTPTPRTEPDREGSDAQATISALETQVAELEEKSMAVGAVAPTAPVPETGEVPTTGGGRPGPVNQVAHDTNSLRVKPVRIRIAAAAVDARIEAVGIVDGVMQSPPNTSTVSWYSDLAALGERDNVVMAGYYKTGLVNPAAFSRLNALRPGDEIEMIGSNDVTYLYRVEWVRTFDDSLRVPIQEIIGTTAVASLTLMTGAEPFDAGLGDYQGMTVVRAVLTGEPQTGLPVGVTPAIPLPTATVDAVDAAAATGTVGALQTHVASPTTEVGDLHTRATVQPTPSPLATRPRAAGTPAVSSGGVDLLYYYVRNSPYGGAVVLGEVRNTTRQLVDAPQLNITFYDTEGRIVDTTEVNALHSVLEPGASMPIEGSTDLEPGQWAREDVHLQGGGPADNQDQSFYAPSLEIRNVNEVAKDTGSLRVLGEVYNGGTTAATLVEVQVAVYLSDGRYAGREFTFIDADVLPAGQSAAFEIDGRIDAGSSWTYRLLVSGWPST